MNISVTVTASAMANELSEVEPPLTTSAFTLIGSPTAASTSSEKVRFSCARLEKRITSSTRARSGPGGRSARASRRIRAEFWRPRTSISLPRKRYSPPLLISSSRETASPAIRRVSAALAACTCERIVFSTYWRLAGSSAL